MPGGEGAFHQLAAAVRLLPNSSKSQLRKAAIFGSCSRSDRHTNQKLKALGISSLKGLTGGRRAGHRRPAAQGRGRTPAPPPPPRAPCDGSRTARRRRHRGHVGRPPGRTSRSRSVTGAPPARTHRAAAAGCRCPPGPSRSARRAPGCIPERRAPVRSARSAMHRSRRLHSAVRCRHCRDRNPRGDRRRQCAPGSADSAG